MKKIQEELKSIHKDRPFLVDLTFVDDHKPKPVVLFLHGFKGYKDWGPFNLMAEKFAEHGFVFVKMNFSHNGTTIKHPTDFVDLEAFANNNFSIELDDAATAIDALFDNELPIESANLRLERFYLIGHSRGGAMAILKTNEDPRVKKLVAWSAFSDIEKRYSDDQIEMWKELGTIYVENSRTNQQMPMHYQLVEDYWDNKGRLHIPSAAKSIQVPTLIIHGEDDETVSPKDAKELCSINPNFELELISEANHTFGGEEPYKEPRVPDHFDKVINLSISFFNK